MGVLRLRVGEFRANVDTLTLRLRPGQPRTDRGIYLADCRPPLPHGIASRNDLSRTRLTTEDRRGDELDHRVTVLGTDIDRKDFVPIPINDTSEFRLGRIRGAPSEIWLNASSPSTAADREFRRWPMMIHSPSVCCRRCGG
jgi:hypothetical protein